MTIICCSFTIYQLFSPSLLSAIAIIKEFHDIDRAGRLSFGAKMDRARLRVRRALSHTRGKWRMN
jgi:hypothetical protein